MLLKYPDRKEIADLGNLKIDLKLFRRDGSSAGTIKTVQSLRYESKILRGFKEILALPGAIWNDRGSERLERIPLVNRLVDEYEKERVKNFGVVEDDVVDEDENKTNKNNSSSSSNNNNNNDSNNNNNNNEIFNGTNNRKNNPINRLQISISPLPPIHSIHLEVLANLSPLQHFLFYWKFLGAFLIIGACTAGLWILINIYGLIEFFRLIYYFNYQKKQKEEFEEEFEILENEIENDNEIDNGIEIDEFNNDHKTISEFTNTNEIIINSELPNSTQVAEFIGDLRKRKIKNRNQNEQNKFSFDDEISVFSSELDADIDEDDQNVPENIENENNNNIPDISDNLSDEKEE